LTSRAEFFCREEECDKTADLANSYAQTHHHIGLQQKIRVPSGPCR
jgi:hypothetical protein